MVKPLLVSMLMLNLTTLNVTGINECCPDENILVRSTRRCLIDDVNSNRMNFNCSERTPVIVDHKSDFKSFKYKLLDNGTLLDQQERSTEYCFSNKGDDPNATSPMYVVCIESSSGSEVFDSNTYVVQAILLFISAVFVIFTIIIYSMVPSLLDLQGICIMHTLVGLASGYIFLGIVQIKTDHGEEACKTFAYLVYFSCIYLFLWLVVLSFHIWRTTVKPDLLSAGIKWPVIYHIFAIGGSFIFLIILVSAHYSSLEMWDDIRPGFGEVSCWFKSPREIWIYFYAPIIILLFFNLVFYLWTVVTLWGQVNNRRNTVFKYRLKLCIRLCIIMGITWIFEILTFIIKQDDTSIVGKIMLFLLDLFNILQGVLIFLVLVVFRKRLRRALASKNICSIQFPNSWKHLEDEEMENDEEKLSGSIVEYQNEEKG